MLPAMCSGAPCRNMEVSKDVAAPSRKSWVTR